MSNFFFSVILEADYNLALKMGLINSDFSRAEYWKLYKELYQKG